MKDNNSELDLFVQLASKDKSTRLKSTRAILKRIKQNARNSHVVYLICKRLIRGLGGSNLSFRQGCFTSVVSLFSLLSSGFDLKLIEGIIEKELTPSGNNSKLEEAEAFLGQILAYGSMVMSDFILKKSVDEQNNVFEKLFLLGQKRSYLHHVSFSFLTMFLKKSKREINPDGFIDHFKDLNTDTQDKLNYILTLADHDSKSRLIETIFKTKSFFDPSNASKLVLLLKKYKSKNLLEHECYSTLAKVMSKKSKFLFSFWRSLCEKPSGSEENNKMEKYFNNHDYLIIHLGSELFKECALNNNHLASIGLFNNDFVNLLIRNSRKEKHLVTSILNDFCKAAQSADDESKLSLIKHILFEEGILNFDNITQSKTIMTLTNSLTFDGLSSLVDLYKDFLLSKKDVPEFQSKNKAIISCLNFYTKIINNPKCCDQINWRLDQLIYLLKLGFFKPSEIHLSREVVQNIQEAFLTSLGHRFPNLESFHKVIEGIVVNMDKMLSNDKNPPLVKFTDEMMSSWKSAMNLSEKINKFLKKGGENKEIILVLKIILQYMAIMLLKEPRTAIINIEDLRNIFKELTNKENNSEQRIWIEVLIDLFLNLLSKPNYHHRHLIRCTFKFICPFLNIQTFQQITEVLNLSYESEINEDENSDIENEGESSNDSPGNSSDSDEEIEDEEVISTNEKLRFELQNALGGESGNESIDLDDMDEEEGKKLDETLSNIFRANYKRKKTNHLSKYQNQLAHFRTRVMDLIEICTEVTLPLSYWLHVLVPLVDLLGSTIGQNKLDSLGARIRCCIKKLNSSKIVTDEVAIEDVINILENLFDKASKSRGVYADMKSELVLVITFLLKSSKSFINKLKPKHLEENILLQCFQKHLISFFSSKNSLPDQLFTGLAAIGWDGVFVFLPYIIECSFDENLKFHKRSIGLKIIEVFYKTPQYFDGHLEKYYNIYFPRMQDVFSKSFANSIKLMCQNKEINMKFYSELYGVINFIINKERSSLTPIIVDKDEIKQVLKSNLTELPLMKGQCKQNYKKLCHTLAINSEAEPNENVCTLDLENSVKTTGKKLLKRKRKNDVLGKKKKLKTLKVKSENP